MTHSPVVGGWSRAGEVAHTSLRGPYRPWLWQRCAGGYPKPVHSANGIEALFQQGLAQRTGLGVAQGTLAVEEGGEGQPLEAVTKLA